MKKDNNSSDFEEFLKKFDAMSLRCSIYDSKRKEIKLKDIPYNLKKELMLMMKISEFKENPTFVYCNKCDTYSILSSIKTSSKI